MLQKDYLLDWRTIYQNILIGLEVKKMISKNSKEYVDELLHKYGLYEFREKYPSQLSGGMRQRVALIRTLTIRPDVLLLDINMPKMNGLEVLKKLKDNKS